MAQIHWINPLGGGFTNAVDWSLGTVPGAGDDAILDAAGSTPYVVTSSVAETVASVQLAATATLSITNGLFTATSGTGAGANAGIVLVGNGASFEVGAGAVDNAGSIQVGTGHGAAELIIGSNHTGAVTLTGGGEVTIRPQSQLYIQGFYGAGASLTNFDNILTIDGGFNLFEAGLTNAAAGVIDFNSNGRDGMAFSRSVANAGLIEITGAGAVKLTAVTLANAGGTITVGPGSDLQLGLQTFILGGALTIASGGALVNADTPRYNFVETATLTNLGTILSPNGGRLAMTASTLNAGTIIDDGELICGAVDNIGGISLGTASAPAVLLAGTFSGGGQVAFSDNARNIAAGRIVNVDNTITGAGQFGYAGRPLPGLKPRNGQLSLVNEAAGVIDANGSNALVILLPKQKSFDLIDNAGLMEATGAGGLVIESAMTNDGVLEANGGNVTADMAVTGSGSGLVNAGTLSLLSAFTENVTFGGASGVLRLGQSQGYTGLISGFSTTGRTSLDLRDIGFVGAGEASFSGTAAGGVLTVSDGVHTASLHLSGDYLTSAWVASSDGQGGTIVTDSEASSAVTPPHAFIAAMAGLGASAVAVAHFSGGAPVSEPLLAGPRG